MDTTTTRLRKAFKYPNEDDHDDAREEMDEQGNLHAAST